jgi:polyisoprenoid-binding protein YceI
MRQFGIIVSVLMMANMSIRAHGDNYQLDSQSSLLGAVVYKGGFGAALAHNHLIFARNVQSFTFSIPDPTKLESGSFAAQVTVNDISADDPAQVKIWNPKLEEMGLVNANTPLSEIKESDRKDIEESLRGKDQMDGAQFPAVTAKLLALTASPGNIGKLATTHRAKININIHGVSRDVEWPTLIALNGTTAQVVTSGPLKFSDFGIKPISIGFGAIQNKDEFKLVVHLTARKDAR